MNSFQKCQTIEQESREILLRYARDVQGFELEFDDDRRSQLSGVGDALVFTPAGTRFSELKAERRYTGNFFIEQFSNQETGRLGWLESSKADLLWYHFLDSDICYSMQLKSLRNWSLPNINKYRVVTQKKYSQKNTTTGWLVPVDVLVEAVGAGVHHPLAEMQALAVS